MGCRNLFVFAALAVLTSLVNLSEAFKQKCTKCPPGYTFVPASGKCFKLHQIPKGQPAGWSNYRRACQSLPPKEWARSTADLASVHGVPAQNISQELAKKLGEKASVWIGLHQVGAVWKWSDDSNVDYKLWGQGQPDDWHKQDCVRLTLPNGHWDDIQCNENQVVRGAICQVLPICKRSPVATPKPTPKRTKSPKRTTPRRRPTPKATRRPLPTRRATPKPTPKRTQPPRRTTVKQRPPPKTTRRRPSPPKTTASPVLSTTRSEQNKPTERPGRTKQPAKTPKPTTSKLRDCPCRKHKSTSHPSTRPQDLIESTAQPKVSEEPTTKAVECGGPPMKPQGPKEPEHPKEPPKPEDP